MLIEDSFLFLSIPRCATVSFEKSIIEQGFHVRYPNNLLLNKKTEIGLIPTFHNHYTISTIRKMKPIKNQLRDLECISIYREPVERFVSGWKYVLKNIKEVDEESYNILKDVDNNNLIDRMNTIIVSPFELVKQSTFDKIIGHFIGYDKSVNPKFNNTRYVFSAVLSPTSRWHENDVTIRYFDIRNLGQLEEYIKEVTGKEFVMKKTNDTQGIETSLVVDDVLKDFYFTKLEVPQKSQKTII